MNFKKILSLLAVAFTSGFVIGSILSLINDVLPHQYFQNKMYVLFLESLQKEINIWVLIALALLIIFLFFFLLMKFVFKMRIFEFLNISRADKERRVSTQLSLSLSLTFFFCGGWAVNHFWLPKKFHPISLMGNTVFLIITMLITWLLVKVRWEILLNSVLLKYFKAPAFALCILFGVLNISVFSEKILWNPRTPDVILISVDTLRADHIGCYGYSRNTSPHIDSFAKENILFHQFYVQDDLTLPSHMSILTSLYPITHGVKENNRLEKKITTLTEVMKNNNYLTLGIIRECGWMDAKFGFDHGFDEYIVKDYNPKNRELNAEYQNRVIANYLRKYKKKKKFIFVHYYDVHSDYERLPYDSPLPFRNMFYPDYSGNFTGEGEGKKATEYLIHINHHNIQLKRDDLDYIKSLYDGGIAYVDKCIGDLFRELKDLGLYDNSLIILTSDHGEEFQEHGFMLHGGNFFYEEMMKVPLIVKLPGRNNDHIDVKNMVESIDIMPSILSLLGIESKPIMQGKSFTDLILGDGKERDFVYGFGIHGQSFVRKGDWKLLNKNTKNEENYRLYNLSEDPEERKDIKTIFPEKFESLKARLLLRYSEIFKKAQKTDVVLTEKQKELLKSLGYLH